VGSLVTPQGARPFRLDIPADRLQLDEYDPQPAVADLTSSQTTHLEGTVRRLAGMPIDQVRFGVYFCGVCGEWVAATKTAWSLYICLSCSLDRDSELWEFYS
jgi:hypothetical protein